MDNKYQFLKQETVKQMELRFPALWKEFSEGVDFPVDEQSNLRIPIQKHIDKYTASAKEFDRILREVYADIKNISG